jgi:dTDP-4-amino-4,6-dideoxygalactose transaminase
LLIIPAKPFDTFSFKKKSIDESYEEMGHPVFFTLGRHALLYAIRHFGINPIDKVLCPAYICKSAIKPMIDAGFEIIFIDITEDLNINLDLLIQEIERYNCKAVILPEYFGLFDTTSESIYEECTKRGVILIKDCAHSYLTYLFASNKHFCDAAIFSIRKSVNINYGGVAIINRKKNTQKSTIKETLLSRMKFDFAKRFEQIIIGSGVNIYGKTITYFKNLIEKESYYEKKIKDNINNHIVKSDKSLYLLNKNSYSMEVATLRRINFLNLKKLLATSGVTSPFVNLNDKVPQVYPIYGDIEFCTYLRNRGIGATMWPFSDIPIEVKKRLILYPNTSYFHKHLICLPIHQGLTENHLKKISEIIHNYVSNKK